MPKNTRITVATTTATSPIIAPKRGPSPSTSRNPRAFVFTRTSYDSGEGRGPEGGGVSYAPYRCLIDGTPSRIRPLNARRSPAAPPTRRSDRATPPGAPPASRSPRRRPPAPPPRACSSRPQSPPRPPGPPRCPAGVLDHERLGRVDSEPLGGRQIALRVRLAARDVARV